MSVHLSPIDLIRLLCCLSLYIYMRTAYMWMYCATGYVHGYMHSIHTYSWVYLVPNTWVLDSLIGALSCAPHNFYFNPFIASSALLPVIDRNGNEAPRFIVNDASTTLTTSSFSRRTCPVTIHEHHCPWYLPIVPVNCFGVCVWLTADDCGPHIPSFLPLSASARN